MYMKEVSKHMQNVTPQVQSLCCYDYFQERMCSRCVVIIFMKNCAVTVLL